MVLKEWVMKKRPGVLDKEAPKVHDRGICQGPLTSKADVTWSAWVA